VGRQTDLGLRYDDMFEHSVAYCAGDTQHSVHSPRSEPHNRSSGLLHSVSLILSAGILRWTELPHFSKAAQKKK